MLKNTFYHLTIIVCVVQVGFWSFPFRVFSFVPEKDLMEKSYFSQNETNEINVVFFEKKDGSLFPKCQIFVDEYPGILPDFINEHSSTFHLQSAGLSDLEVCGQGLSLKLVAEAEYFALYPKVALTPVIGAAFLVATNLFSCGVGLSMGALGGLELAKEWEIDLRGKRDENFERRGIEYLSYFPTRGEFLTSVAPVAGAALGFTQTSTYAEILFGSESSWARTTQLKGRGKQLAKSVIKTSSRAAGGLGFVCGMVGGAVGYFMGSSDSVTESLDTILNRFIGNSKFFLSF